jgi:hypothetical protein
MAEVAGMGTDRAGTDVDDLGRTHDRAAGDQPTRGPTYTSMQRTRTLARQATGRLPTIHVGEMAIDER